MLAIARWCTTHRKWVVLGWVLLLLGVNFLAQTAGTEYSNNFTLPNSDAQRASDLLQHNFPAQAGDRDQIVFKTSTGTVHDPAVQQHMEATLKQISTLPHVASVISPYGPQASHTVSSDGRIAFATVVFDEKANELPNAAVERVQKTAFAARQAGLQVEMGGQAVESTQRAGFGLSTAVGLLAAIVVLLITFGSFIAMGLPIATALAGLGTGLGVIALFTHVVDTPNFASELAAMIGLGVGIDYALFILTRYREAYHTPGPAFENPRESVVQAMDTAGRAVLFAGCTVVIALLGMMLLGVNFLYGVAMSASIGVLLVMFASLTLLPALLSIAGRRVAGSTRRLRRPHLRHRHDDEHEGPRATPAGAGSTWLRWSAFVARRPWAITIASAAFMLAIASPAIALRLGSSDASNDPSTQTTHRAYELLAEGFGQGFNGPLQVVVKLPPASAPASGGTAAPAAGTTTAHEAALSELHSAVAATPGVVQVSQPRVSPSGEVAVLTVYPSSSPQAYATSQLVTHLREDVLPPVENRTGAKTYVGGVTAGSVDFAITLGHKLPLFIGVVVLLSALLLLIVFRSLIVPVQAAIMNLLSIGASLGVIVVVFQWGWLGSAAGVQKGPVESFIPVMLFAIVFGLSMDYEVFIISRIHERWTHTRDASRSVSEGLALTGRVVTAAAAIMVCVFLSFMLGEERVIKEFGLALSTAVLLDAVVVRCLLLPATLHLLGARTWAVPAWLDRRLPRLNVEGTVLHEHAERQREELAAVGAGNGSRANGAAAAEREGEGAARGG